MKDIIKEIIKDITKDIIFGIIWALYFNNGSGKFDIGPFYNPTTFLNQNCTSRAQFDLEKIIVWGII